MDKDLPFELLALDPASGSASTCNPIDSPCPDVECVFTLVTPGEQEVYWSISRREADTGASPLAGRTVRKVSQYQSQEDATERQEDKRATE